MDSRHGSATPGHARTVFCKCILILLALIVIFGVICAIFYAAFHPKIPNYTVDSFRISDLSLNNSGMLFAKIDAEINIKNPNEKVGIYFKEGGQASVWNGKTKICDGEIPKLYLGHNDIVQLNVGLSGTSRYGSKLMDAVQTGSVALDLKVVAPVVVKMGSMKLPKVNVYLQCVLIVQSLDSITTKDCRHNVKL